MPIHAGASARLTKLQSEVCVSHVLVCSEAGYSGALGLSPSWFKIHILIRGLGNLRKHVSRSALALISPEQPHQLALNLHAIWRQDAHLVARVGGLERDR